MSVLHYTKRISRKEYEDIYIRDIDLIDFYKGVLKEINPKIDLNTSLKDLITLYKVVEKLENIKKQRLKIAPSEKLMLDFFKQDLESIIEFKEYKEEDEKGDDQNYWNQYRKESYQYIIRGENPTLKDLGYLLLKFVYVKKEGREEQVSYTNIFDTKKVLISLAEGAAVAYYLHDPKFPFLEELYTKNKEVIYIDQTETQILDKVSDMTKVFALDSGDSTLDSDFYAIAIDCTKSYYPTQRYKIIPRIRKLIERNLDYRELIVERFIFGLKIFIKERQQKFSDPNNTVKTNAVLAGLYQAMEGTSHILSWFQDGMGNYVEKNLTKDSDSTEQFETINEALKFLQRYDLIETPKTQILKSIQEALFNQQFNVYLLEELKVETEVKRIHEGKEMFGIKNWTSYLNEQTLLDFLKHQKHVAEQGYQKHLYKKNALHIHVNGDKEVLSLITETASEKAKGDGFAEIFSVQDWKKYISALEQTSPPLLNHNWEFIGKPVKHKGVICSWIKHLQISGMIKISFNRSQLAAILNKELKNFKMGKDGKTFDNISTPFDNDFKDQLIKLTN